jgi:hypothetical protein
MKSQDVEIRGITIQIIRHFDFSRYIAFDIFIRTLSRYIVKTIYLEKTKHLIIWNRGINNDLHPIGESPRKEQHQEKKPHRNNQYLGKMPLHKV